MLTFAYPAVFQCDEAGRYTVSFPDLRGARTDGANIPEAMEEGIDCLGSWLAEQIAMKQPIPAPSQPKRGHRLIPVPFWIVGKLALYLAMRETGISNSELASGWGSARRWCAECWTPITIPNPRNCKRHSRS